MNATLVRTKTPDGVTLDGALQRPVSAPGEAPFDAVILVHGTGSNFYQSTMLEAVAQAFVEGGVAALRVNTRGHDGVSIAVSERGGMRLGAAFETVDHCRHDLAGWLAFARERVGPRVAFLGHSLGAVKCLYAAIHEPHLSPAAIIAISPPRLSYAWFCESERRDEFLTTFAHAESLMNAGQPNALIEATMPLPMLISAAGFVEKYGPDERLNFLPLLPRLMTPTLFTFGGLEIESNVAFQGVPEAIAALKSSSSKVAVIPSADHFYTGARDHLIQTLISHFEGERGA